MGITTDRSDPDLHVPAAEGGQNKKYLVLSDEEIARGFVRPVCYKYIHDTCGVVTRMGFKIAETYARDPKFYGSTWCVSCKGHFPVGEFKWDDGRNQIVGS